MSDNRFQTEDIKFRSHSDRRTRLSSIRCLTLLLLGMIGCASASAQCRVYVPTHKSDSVSAISTSNNTVTAVLPVGVQPLSAAVSPDGKFVYVTNSGWFLPNNHVSVISTTTNSVLATIPLGQFPVGVAFAPNGQFAYIANSSSNNVSVINTALQTVVTTISVGSNPWGVAFSPDGAFAYVSNQSSNNLSVINTATNSVVATV